MSGGLVGLAPGTGAGQFADSDLKLTEIDQKFTITRGTKWRQFNKDEITTIYPCS